MLDNNTIAKLREMKLSAMATALEHQLDNRKFHELSFEERIGLMVDAEWIARQNNRLARLTRNAGLSQPEASLEDIEYHPDRELDKALITRLSTCNFVDEHHNLIIMGATGGGKPIWPTPLAMLLRESCILSAMPVCPTCLVNWPSPEQRALTERS